MSSSSIGTLGRNGITGAPNFWKTHFHHLNFSDMLIANIATDTSIQHFILKNLKNSIKYGFDTSTFSSKNAETKTPLYLSLLFHASQ